MTDILTDPHAIIMMQNVLIMLALLAMSGRR